MIIKHFYLEKYDRHDYLIAKNQNEIDLWKRKLPKTRKRHKQEPAKNKKGTSMSCLSKTTT